MYATAMAEYPNDRRTRLQGGLMTSRTPAWAYSYYTNDWTILLGVEEGDQVSYDPTDPPGGGD